MARARGEGSPLPCWLIQDAAPGWLRLQAQPAGPQQIALGEALAVDGGGVRVTGDGADGGRWLSAEEMPADLSPLDRPVPLRLETATEVLEVAAVRRPRPGPGVALFRQWFAGSGHLPAGLVESAMRHSAAPRRLPPFPQ
jgi:hypothetical protein